jgi:hypothetical protein
MKRMATSKSCDEKISRKDTALRKILVLLESVISRMPLLHVGVGLDQLLGSASSLVLWLLYPT